MFLIYQEIQTKSDLAHDTFSTADLVGNTRGTVVHTLTVIRISEDPVGPEGRNISMLRGSVSSCGHLLRTVKLERLYAVC